MTIDKVTMTGADDSVSPINLFDIAMTYPFVEWGILLSRNSQGQNRFPSKKWMDMLAFANERLVNPKNKLKLSGHLCGGYVRQILMGSDQFINELDPIWKSLNRIQINTHGIKHDWDGIGLVKIIDDNKDKEFIFQFDDVNKDILHTIAPVCKNVSTLFDLSHGAGVLPKEWPVPYELFACGYAGGLSPNNVANQIELIKSKVGDKTIWIDMETHIRSNFDKQFDLDKVKRILDICNEIKKEN